MKKFALYFIVLIIVLSVIGAVTFVSYPLMYAFVYLPYQGKLVGVKKDAQWITDDRMIYFIRDGSLYSIGIKGTEEKKIHDSATTFQLSPDGKTMAVYGRNGSGNVANRQNGIWLVALATYESQEIARGQTVGPPLWTFDGSYLFDKLWPLRGVISHTIRVYDISEGTSRFVDVPNGVVDVYPSKKFNKLFYTSFQEHECYEFDIEKGATKEFKRYQDGKGLRIWDCVREEDIYWGTYNWLSGAIAPVISPSGKKMAYSSGGGSLWLTSNGDEELLVEYKGVYDSKFSRGIEPLTWDSSERYLISSFKGSLYVSDTTTKQTGYLVKGEHARFHSSQGRKWYGLWY